ncbi:hypothetical protein Taro_054477 [Colocasia esculenta]|uniref:Uncharacterized protein n=1 Tax=Colocasia esculenta TaxID=4460 RepID=A0A843XRB6_COLES|nr:hypothetical protein [Colocasia esculenta]
MLVRTVACESLAELSWVVWDAEDSETSQQRQGARRAEETGRYIPLTNGHWSFLVLFFFLSYSFESNAFLLVLTDYMEWRKMFQLVRISKDANNRSKMLSKSRSELADIKCKAND